MAGELEYMDKETNCRGDMQYLERVFEKISKNEQIFFDTLEGMLEVATLLPLCEDEYVSYRRLFFKFERVYDTLHELREVLRDYDLELQLSPLVASKMK